MKTKTTLMLVTIVAGITFLTSCSKKGCTDPNAENYCENCKKDDGSCTYQGNVVFWYNKATADSLTADGATALTYYIDGSVIGSSAANVYWTSAPNCSQNGSITSTKDLGTSKNKSYSYQVKDQTGFIYWSGTINFTANTCEATQLTW